MYNVINDDNFKEMAEGLTIENMSDPRLPMALVLDTSSSMSGDKIKCLNNAVKVFLDDAQKDKMAAARVDLKIIPFNSDIDTARMCDWQSINNYQKSEINLQASGCTSLGKALNYAYDEIIAQKQKYHSIGIPSHHRAIVLIVSDGEPTDDVTGAVSRASKLENENGIQTWALAIPGANEIKLKGWFERTIVNKTADTTQFFRWFSKGMMDLSKSHPGEKITYDKLPSDTVFIDKIPDSLI